MCIRDSHGRAYYFLVFFFLMSAVVVVVYVVCHNRKLIHDGVMNYMSNGKGRRKYRYQQLGKGSPA